MMNLAMRTATLVGRPYQLGVTDCFRTVLTHIEESGVEIPAEFEGQTRASYAALFRRDPVEAKVVMLRFLAAHLEELQPHQAMAGDILLLSMPSRPEALPFLAIDGGNGNFIAASKERGVALSPMKFYRTERVFRCHRQSR